jgi:HK97 family phage prohead protease
MDFKQISQEVKDLDSKAGIVTAYANVYNNIDSDGDISAPGSFNKTVTENAKRIRVLKDHNSTIVLGVHKEMNPNDPYGLYTVTQFNMNKEVSRDMFTDITMAKEHGLNAELSIGYGVVARDQKNKSMITEYKLWEYSFLSSWAANELAIVGDIKSHKSPEQVITLLTKMYNLPYSDSRLQQVETILKSLEKEPLQEQHSKDEPVDAYKSLLNLLN